MSKKEKLHEKIRNSPKSVKFSEMKKMLEDFGFTHSRGKGSHNNFTHPALGALFVLTIPIRAGSQEILPMYVKLALKAIDDVAEWEG